MSRIETKCVQGGYTPGNGEPRQVPIIQSTTFKYATSEDMGKLFDLEASGYFYSRLQNPTCDTVAAKICELEGGSAAMLITMILIRHKTQKAKFMIGIPCILFLQAVLFSWMHYTLVV